MQRFSWLRSCCCEHLLEKRRAAPDYTLFTAYLFVYSPVFSTAVPATGWNRFFFAAGGPPARPSARAGSTLVKLAFRTRIFFVQCFLMATPDFPPRLEHFSLSDVPGPHLFLKEISLG